MKKTHRRRNNGTYISKAQRDCFRNILRTLQGEKCCWCKKPMLFPTMGEPVSNVEEMATIEHYFSKKENNPGYLFLMKLCHKKCNR
jgi:hypothetical protein